MFELNQSTNEVPKNSTEDSRISNARSNAKTMPAWMYDVYAWKGFRGLFLIYIIIT